MNGLKFFIATNVVIAFFVFASCKNGQTQSTDKPVADTIPEVLKEDTLVETSVVIVVDTFETGEPLKIHFSDTKKPEDIYEKQYYKSGKLFIEGSVANDKRTGKWIAYYESGQIWSIGYFEDGLKNGSSEVYYENGKVRYTKNYEKDVAQGLWKFYGPEGNQVGEIMYENGKILWQKGTPEK